MSNVIISLLLYSFLFSEFQVNIIDLIQIQGNKKTKDHFSDKLKIVENRTYGISKIYLIKLR